MNGKMRLYRALARHRAAGYAGRPKKKWDKKRIKQLCASAMLLFGTGMLYVADLPGLMTPKGSYRILKMLAESENKERTEEIPFAVRYAGATGTYLAVSHAEGVIPDYILPEKEEVEEEQETVAVKEILEERFGTLSEVSFQSFLSNYYIEDPSTKADESLLKPAILADYDLTLQKGEEPQILIFHTHGSEGYADSREGVTEDTIIGAGALLAKELREVYGYNVIHETSVFDRKADGTDDRNNAYNNALPVISAILEQYPSIEVVIDLHRDSGDARTVEINGVKTAKVMLFNGLCRTKDGPITYYSNSNLQGNLAFSLHLQVTGNELYPGLMHRIYLKSYRYNMHLTEKYCLVELGTHKNTVAEAKAAMKPFAKTINAVLSGNRT